VAGWADRQAPTPQPPLNTAPLDGIGNAATLQTPTELAYDPAGRLYFIDLWVGVRSLELATQSVKTISTAGVDLKNLWGTGTLAYDGAGSLYVSDAYSTDPILKMSPSTGAVNGEITMTVEGVRALGMGSAGTLYAAESGRLHAIALATGTDTPLPCTGQGCSYFCATPDQCYFGPTTGKPLWDGAGRLYFPSGSAPCGVITYDLATGSASTVYLSLPGPPTPLGTCSPHFALDGKNLYAANPDDGVLYAIPLDTHVPHPVAGLAAVTGSSDGTGTAARFDGPTAVVADADGNLYVADNPNRAVRLVDPTTGAVSTIASDKYGQELVSVTFGAGNVYFSGYPHVYKLDVKTRNVTGIPALTSSWPFDLAVDSAENIYFTSTRARSGLHKYEAKTGTTTTLTDHVYVNGLAVDDAGHLFFTTRYVGALNSEKPHSIMRFELATGAITTVAGSADPGSRDGIGEGARFRNPSSLTYDKGSLYVADTGNHTIRKIDLATRAVTTVVGDAAAGGGIVRPGPLPARLNRPAGVAITPNGMAIVDENAVLVVR
jgi:sugar lactone lactonase YvrE